MRFLIDSTRVIHSGYTIHLSSEDVVTHIVNRTGVNPDKVQRFIEKQPHTALNFMGSGQDFCTERTARAAAYKFSCLRDKSDLSELIALTYHIDAWQIIGLEKVMQMLKAFEI